MKLMLRFLVPKVDYFARFYGLQMRNMDLTLVKFLSCFMLF